MLEAKDMAVKNEDQKKMEQKDEKLELSCGFHFSDPVSLNVKWG